MKLGQKYSYEEKDEFMAELKKRANGREILGHMFGGFINFYAGDYDSDNRIGMEVIQDGYYLWEKD